jgi:hypothetical protein
MKGRVDAIGPGISYTTLIEGMPVIVNARHYDEYSVVKRWDGSLTIISATVRF